MIKYVVMAILAARLALPAPLEVTYLYPGVRVAWTQPGCVVLQSPGRPLVWPDAACGAFGGAVALTPTDLNHTPVNGTVITLLTLDGQFIANVTLDSRAEHTHALRLPQVIR